MCLSGIFLVRFRKLHSLVIFMHCLVASLLFLFSVVHCPNSFTNLLSPSSQRMAVILPKGSISGKVPATVPSEEVIKNCGEWLYRRCEEFWDAFWNWKTYCLREERPTLKCCPLCDYVLRFWVLPAMISTLQIRLSRQKRAIGWDRIRIWGRSVAGSSPAVLSKLSVSLSVL